MTPVAIGDIQRTQGTRKTCIMPQNRYRHLLLCLHMVEEYVRENFKPPRYGCGGVCYIFESSEQLLHKINMQKNLKSELGRKDVFKVHSYIFLCCKTLSFVIIDPSGSVLVVVTTNCIKKKKNPP